MSLTVTYTYAHPMDGSSVYDKFCTMERLAYWLRYSGCVIADGVVPRDLDNDGIDIWIRASDLCEFPDEFLKDELEADSLSQSCNFGGI